MNKRVSFDLSWLRLYILPLLLLGAILSEINVTISEGKIPLRISLGDCVIVFLILVYLYGSRANLKEIAQRNIVPVTIGVLFIIISSATSCIDNDLWLISIKFCIKYCALFLVLTLICQDSLISRGTLTALLLIMIFINVVGMLEYFMYDELKDFLLLFKSKESLIGRKYALAGSVFSNSNPYGVFNAMFIVVMLGISLGYRAVVNRYLLGITLIFCMAGVILSSSRNAILSLVVGVLLIAGVVLKDKKSAIKVFVIGVVVLCLMAFLALKFQKSFAYKMGNAIPAASKIYKGECIEMGDLVPRYDPEKRILIWKTGFELFKEKPILGIGASQFQYRNGLTFGGRISNSFNMHNFFGEMLVNHGIVGLSLILVLIIEWFKKAKMRWQLIIIITLLASHMVDCFITYNILWLIFVPWLIAVTTRDPADLFCPVNTCVDPS